MIADWVIHFRGYHKSFWGETLFLFQLIFSNSHTFKKAVFVVPATPVSTRENLLYNVYELAASWEEKKKKKPCCQNEVICLESRASSILEGREPGALTSLALWHTEPLSKPVSGATEFSPEITWQLLSLRVWSKSFQGPYFKAACP